MNPVRNALVGSRLPRLRRYLWYWVMGALSIVWFTLAAMSYYTGYHEAEEITDGQLVAVAAALQAWPRSGSPVPMPEAVARNAYAPEYRVIVRDAALPTWDSHGMADLIPSGLSAGFHTVDGQGAQRWRVLVVEHEALDRRWVVMVDIGHSKDLGRDMAEHIVRPALIVLPLVALLLAWAIRRGFRPLDRLATEIEALDTASGKTLAETPRFAELSGTVVAINRLVGQLQEQVARERRFAADVAHELRTPLASAVLQARLARDAHEAGHRQAALQQVERDAMRAGHILTQLVELARAQAPEALVPVHLPGLAEKVLSEHAQQAHERDHELALHVQAGHPPASFSVSGHPLMLELMLRNLVDNALRHTPAGTLVQIDIGSDGQGVGLAVSDDGQRHRGDAADQSAAAESAGKGLGLGLSLVQRMAQGQGIEFGRERAPPPFTTRFSLRWPRSAES